VSEGAFRWGRSLAQAIAPEPQQAGKFSVGGTLKDTLIGGPMDGLTGGLARFLPHAAGAAGAGGGARQCRGTVVLFVAQFRRVDQDAVGQRCGEIDSQVEVTRRHGSLSWRAAIRRQATVSSRLVALAMGLAAAGPDGDRSEDIYVTRDSGPASAAYLDLIAAARTYLPQLIEEVRSSRRR
jgi:hypothetical protein